MSLDDTVGPSTDVAEDIYVYIAPDTNAVVNESLLPAPGEIISLLMVKEAICPVFSDLADQTTGEINFVRSGSNSAVAVYYRNSLGLLSCVDQYSIPNPNL